MSQTLSTWQAPGQKPTMDSLIQCSQLMSHFTGEETQSPGRKWDFPKVTHWFSWRLGAEAQEVPGTVLAHSPCPQPGALMPSRWGEGTAGASSLACCLSVLREGVPHLSPFTL